MFILVKESTGFILEVNMIHVSHFSEHERSNYKKEADSRKERAGTGAETQYLH